MSKYIHLIELKPKGRKPAFTIEPVHVRIWKTCQAVWEAITGPEHVCPLCEGYGTVTHLKTEGYNNVN